MRGNFQCAQCGKWVPYVIVDGRKIYNPADFPDDHYVLCFQCTNEKRAQERAARVAQNQAPLL